jgi:hypothetical protein
MHKATKFTDRPHARIYQAWLTLPAWRTLSGNAAKLLCAMLADYRSGRNGKLAWSDKRAGYAIGMSESSGRRALEELEVKGWIAIQCIGKMRRDMPTTYALAGYPNDETGEPATMAFEHWRP